MIRLPARTVAALFLMAALSACSPLAPAPFSLRSGDGTIHPLFPDSRPAPGFEGTVGGDARTSVLFTLEKAVTVSGKRSALEIRYILSGAARMDLYPEGKKTAPFETLELSQGPGELVWIIPLEEGSNIGAVRFTALSSTPGAKAEDSTLRVLGLELGKASYGFEKRKDGARFSKGAALVRDSVNGSETIRVEYPYGLDEHPVARIRAGRSLLRVETHSGRSAVFDPAQEGVSYLPLSILDGAGTVSVQAGKTDVLESVSILPAAEAGPAGPLPLDLAVILALPAPADSAVAYSLYRWSALPDCLVFDFKDYSAQDAYLKRLAFFVEKEGYRGRLVSDAEIAKLHGWNAHDYRAEDLAAFFDKADRTSFPLSAPELELRGILEREGILVREGGRIRKGRGAFISIARESTAYLRRLFLNHEASHALFFLDAAYRDLARSAWKEQGVQERRFWNVFLSNRDYDPADAYLSYNEFQAYLVQQAPARLESWLRDVAYARLAKSYPDRAAEILADLEIALPAFKARAETLDAYLRSAYGFRAGSFERVRL